jgi:hypothetical protein
VDLVITFFRNHHFKKINQGLLSWIKIFIVWFCIKLSLWFGLGDQIFVIWTLWTWWSPSLETTILKKLIKGCYLELKILLCDFASNYLCWFWNCELMLGVVLTMHKWTNSDCCATVASVVFRLQYGIEISMFSWCVSVCFRVCRSVLFWC